jgi:hypothetical protein
MNVSAIARKASVVVSGIVGVALLVLVLEDRDPPPPPETEPKAVVEKPPAPEPAPQPEIAKPLAMTTVALPPPPMPEPPRVQPTPPPKEPAKMVAPVRQPTPPPAKPVKVVKPMQPEQTPPPAKPVKLVKAMQPKPTPPPAKPATVLKPIRPEQAPLPARTFEPLRPEPQPKPVVRKPDQLVPPRPALREEPVARTIEPLRPTPPAEIVEKPSLPVEPLRPEPIQPLKAEKIPEPLVAEKPIEPEPAPQEPPTIKVSAHSSPRVAKEGRALLRLLEHGSGPAIEISWPTGGSVRHRMYGLLSGCYGMRTVVMDASGNLYNATGQRATKWDLNLDRFSGFVRQPNGYTAPEEHRKAAAIRRYHGMGRIGRVVRLFPRNVDALFLGGLKQALGERYKTARSIRAAYRREGSRLFIEGIVADGVGVDGRIAFATVAGTGCR